MRRRKAGPDIAPRAASVQQPLQAGAPGPRWGGEEGQLVASVKGCGWARVRVHAVGVVWSNSTWIEHMYVHTRVKLGVEALSRWRSTVLVMSRVVLVMCLWYGPVASLARAAS